MNQPVNNSSNIALRMEHISKSFGPVQALKNVTFSARAGSVHALCGENGAGKSTLMKVLSGVHSADSGRIWIHGEEQHFRNPGDALNAGVSMLYQELDLAGDLSVSENLFLGRELMKKNIPFQMDHKRMIAEARRLIEENNFQIDPEARVDTLTPGGAQVVELLKALLRKASVIVMDEPTSSLSERETEQLFRIIDSLRAKGLCIIYISHRMEELLRLADDVSVLRDGEVVFSAPAKNLDIPTIVRHMVGRELHEFYPARNARIGEICFSAEHLFSPEGVNDVSFHVRHGEIVGMAGLVGAGRSETARAVFGVVPKTSGVLQLNGRELHIRSPRDAIQAGIGYLTEDRKRTGLCTILPCGWNMTLPNGEKIGMKVFLDLAKERALCVEMGKRVNLKWESPDAPADSLSGGNQQKVLIGRWLMADSEFLIFDEPTRGIDVGAKKEVYALLNQLAESGKAILVISSELPELFGVTDRILVLRRGRLAASLQTKETSPEAVMHLAAVENQD